MTPRPPVRRARHVPGALSLLALGACASSPPPCGHGDEARGTRGRNCVALTIEAPAPLHFDLRVDPPDAPARQHCGDTSADNQNCGACGHACPRGNACSAGRCVHVSGFRMERMDITGCVLSANHEPVSSDDRGGLAVSSQRVFYTGDGATVALSPEDLSGIVSIGVQHDSMVTDLRTQTVYVMLDAGGVERPAGWGQTGTAITQLATLDPTSGAMTAQRIPLSTPITFNNDSGVYSGWGGAVFHTGSPTTGPSAWFHVALPGGTVTPLGNGPAAPNHMTCETWAHWGIAESFGGETTVVYMRNGAGGQAGIYRYNVRDGTSVPITLVPSIGDVCMLGYSHARGRWYFHYEGAPSFAPPPNGQYGEFVGYCSAAALLSR